VNHNSAATAQAPEASRSATDGSAAFVRRGQRRRRSATPAYAVLSGFSSAPYASGVRCIAPLSATEYAPIRRNRGE
jgi:hypothetical protein